MIFDLRSPQAWVKITLGVTRGTGLGTCRIGYGGCPWRRGTGSGDDL